MSDSIARIRDDVVACVRCPRLVKWRQEAAESAPARFRGDQYWARPVPGFGDVNARLLVVGLAPAAHGGNRTGRIFTGDRSGDWLFRALHKARFANQATSVRRDDGLRLKDCYVSAIVRCAPPANKPSPKERDNCISYFHRELSVLRNVRVLIALGSFAFENSYRALGGASPRPRFGHLAEVPIGDRVLLGSFHPSQQNTFTGKLTEPMFDAVFSKARQILE
ncbi:MAG: uracil-DNA glycosylase [Actinomycetota bacterium]